jgi:hypothetical protein
MKSIASLALICGWLATAVMAAAPDHLTLADLVNHADRWPAMVTVNRDFNFTSGKSVKTGEQIQVDKFDGRQLYVENSGHNIRFIILPTDCDFLDGANAAWSALTPAQRSLDAAALAADRSLWPTKVKLLGPINTGDGQKLAAGLELTAYEYTPDGISTLSPKKRQFLKLDYVETDAVARARQALLLDKEKRPAFMVESLRPLLVDMTGKHFVDDQLNDKQLFLLYFGGKRCPRCLQISPRLISMAGDLTAKYPKLQIVLIGEDDDTPTMLQYMSEKKMPFPAVNPDDLQDVAPQFFDYTKGGGLLPEMILVDRFGNVLKDSDDHRGHYDPDLFLDQLPAFLASQTAAHT